mmetsp:Transcript_479/g.1127  ORF Transcript_479/g.1127 Transcript_479/m.1127 type:complete len:110 (+) Transcript_479:315-644(+)
MMVAMQDPIVRWASPYNRWPETLACPTSSHPQTPDQEKERRARSHHQDTFKRSEVVAQALLPNSSATQLAWTLVHGSFNFNRNWWQKFGKSACSRAHWASRSSEHRHDD